VRPFEPGQVEHFAQNWFANRQNTNADDAERFLLQIQDSRISDLAQIPLLLTMAAIVYELDRNEPLPAYRIGLYRRFVSILLEDEEAERNTREAFRQEWDKRYGRDGKDLADRLFNRRRQLLEHLAHSVQTLNGGSLVAEGIRYAHEQKWISEGIDDAWLSEQMEILLRRTGLLSWRSDEQVFIHSTFREYFAASALARLCDPGDEEADTIIGRWFEENWRGVALFLIGIWSSAGNDVTGVMRNILLSGDRDALLFVGIALSEGANVTAELDDSIIRMLLDSSRRLTYHELLRSPNVLDILGRLRGRESIVIGLESIANTSLVHAEVRYKSAECLFRLGCVEPAAEGWLAIARDSRSYLHVQKKAIRALARGGLTSDLVLIAHDPMLDPDVRLSAASELRKLDQGLNVTEIFSELVKDAALKPKLRFQAAKELRSIISPNDMLPIWHDLIREPTLSDAYRLRAVSELAKMGSIRESVQVLRSFAYDRTGNSGFRIQAAGEVERCAEPDDAIEVWRAIACSQDFDTFGIDDQFIVARALGGHCLISDLLTTLLPLVRHPGTTPGRLKKFLDRLAETNSFQDLERVCLTLARDSSLGKSMQSTAKAVLIAHDPQATRIPSEERPDKSPSPTVVKVTTLEDIVRTLTEAEDLSRAWLTIARDDSIDMSLRLQVAKADILEVADNIVEVWSSLAVDSSVDFEMRIEAANQMSKSYSKDNVIDAWFTILYEPRLDVSRRIQVITELLKTDLLREDAVAILLALAEDSAESSEVRVQAVKTLARFHLTDCLLKLARNSAVDIDIRKQALRIIGQICDSSILSELRRLTNAHPEKEVRRAATHAIEHITERLSQSDNFPPGN